MKFSKEEILKILEGAKDEQGNIPFAIVKKAIEKLKVDPEWIPYSEQLSEDESEQLSEEYVLISKKPSMLSGSKWCVGIGIRMADPRSGKVQWRDSGFGVIQDDEVLAWMPRPKPYKAESEE